MRDLAFVAAWIVLIPLALQGSHLGVLLWVWSSLLAPNDVLYGVGASIPFSKIAALLTLGLILAGRNGGIRLQWDRTALLMFALAMAGLVSQATGLAYDSSLGWDLYQKFAKILLLAVIVIAVMRDRIRLHAILLAICLGIGFIGLAESGKFLISGAAHKVLGTASIGDNNQISLDVLMVLPLVYYLHATAQRRALRVVCIGTGTMLAICVLATNSRAGFVGLAALGVVLALKSRRKISGIFLVGAFALLASQLVNSDWVDRMNTIKSADDDDSFVGRLGAWEVSVAVAFERPLFGGGFHAIQHGDVWDAHAVEAQRMKLFIEGSPGTFPRAAHSIYFEVLGDLGFVGLALFLGLMWIAWLNAAAVRRLVRRSARDDLAWAATMAGCLQTSLLIFLIVGGSLSAAYFDIDYLLIAVLATLRKMVEQAVKQRPAEPRAELFDLVALPGSAFQTENRKVGALPQTPPGTVSLDRQYLG